jgi:hypothetical protein
MALLAGGIAARSAAVASPTRPPLNSFVSRCVRSWIAARASATDFLAAWTPARLSDSWIGGAAVRDHSRRPSSSTRRGARRPALHAIPVTPVASRLTALAGGAAALRARYPLVSALLAELAAPGRRKRSSPRSQERR